MGSADWMPRNLERRVEILFPVLDQDLQQKVWHVLEYQLNDTAKAPELKAGGVYEKVDSKGKEVFNAQEEFCKEHIQRTKQQEKAQKSARVFIPETRIES